MGELQEGMEAGRYTARSIVELYLDRIDALDRSGPELRSILETNEHALTLADELDRERRESSSPAAVAGYPNVTVPAGWVHGLPISDPGAGEAGVRRDASRPLKNTSAACAAASCREPVSVMLVQACAEMIG